MVAGSETGPLDALHQGRIDLLEREGRFPELATELSTLVGQTLGADRAALLARLGEVRLRLDDVARAISAFRQSLEEDPAQPVSRRWLEVMLSEPEHALEAAEVLEAVYVPEHRTVAHSATMLIAVLELRANRTTDLDDRIATWVELGAYFDQAALPPDRQREVSARMLRRTALEWPGGVAKWIERVMRADDPSFRVETLLAALDQPIPEPSTVQELAIAAGEALDQAGRAEDALVCFERALRADPSSPEVVAQLDALASRAGEGPEPRAARYRTALEHATEPERRAALLYALGALTESAFGDTEAALDLYKQALSEAPSLVRPHEALLAALTKLGDEAAIERELERAIHHLDGTERRAAVLRLAESLANRGELRRAIERASELIATAAPDDPALYLVERIAEEAKDLATLRAVHERRVAAAADLAARTRALESFADFLSERADDRPAAVRALKTAAQGVFDGSRDRREAERLYERLLQLAPHDRDIAAHWIDLHITADDWKRLPVAFRALLDALSDPRDAVAPLLALEVRAGMIGAVQPFSEVVDEIVARLSDGDVEPARALLKAKARLLAQCMRLDAAADIYENLIETFCEEDDVRAYVGIVESSSDVAWRHEKRRWLLEWRTTRADDPAAVLIHWATVEEQEFEDVPAAIALLERAVAYDPRRTAALRELSRLRLSRGDAPGALEALSQLRELGGGGDLIAVELTMAKLLDSLHRPGDALPLVAHVLELSPREARARALALRLCRSSDVWLEACDLLERSSGACSPEEQKDLYKALFSATEPKRAAGDAPSELALRRRRWYERLLDLSQGDDAIAALESAAVEFPEEDGIWDAVERLSLRESKANAAVRAYEQAIPRTRSAELAESLGQRLVAFADQYVGDPRALSAALEAVLDVAPTARWAFERVKFVLSSDRQWDVLFKLYDRVLEVSTDDADRAQLLDEAAVAARDLASDPERAIAYWEQFFALRPKDARVDLALERLYERQRKVPELIRHLQSREATLDGDDRTRLRERVAGLWIELENGGAALQVLESLPEEVAESASTLALLERVFALPPPSAAEPQADTTAASIARRAAEHLKQRYTKLNRYHEVARVLAAELPATSDVDERLELLRRLAELRRGLDDGEGEFSALEQLFLLEPEQGDHRLRLGELAVRLHAERRLVELLIRAADAAPDRGLEARALFDAAQLLAELGERERTIALYERVLATSDRTADRLRAAQNLQQLLLSAGRARERCAVLERIAELETDPARRRSAWREAAGVALDALGEPMRAAQAFRTLLSSEPSAQEFHDGLVRALESAERWDELVSALESRAALEPSSKAARRDLGEVARLQSERLADAPSAIATWRRVRERFGTDPASFEALSALLERDGQWTALADLLEQEAAQARMKGPLYQRLAEVHRTRTLDLKAALNAYMRADDVLAAAELTCEHGELLSDDPTHPLELSDKLERSSRVAHAERVLRKQLEHYGPRRPPESVLVYLRLAELLRRANRAPEALAELSAAAERHPGSAELQGMLGEAAFELGDLGRAEQSYRALLLLPSRSPRALGRAEVYLRLSDISARRGDEQSAADHIDSAFESALGSEEEAVALERALKERGRTDLLERAITTRLERTREPGKVLSALADLLDASAGTRASDPVLAERALRLADRSSKDLESHAEAAPPEAWQALVNVYDKLGRPERAVAALEHLASRAVSPDARDEHLLEIARRSLAIPERREDGLARLWELVRRDASDERRCELLLAEATNEGALDQLLRLIEDQAGIAQARDDADRLEVLSVRRAKVLERVGRLPEALAAYRKLATSEPHRQRALREVVRLLVALDAPKNELADAREALLDFDSGAEAAEHAARLAELRREEGDRDGLERALERGFLADPRRTDLRDELWSVLAESGRWERAAELFEQAIRSAPEDGPLKLRLASAYRAVGALDRSLSLLDAALAAGAPEGDVRRERAIVLEAMNRPEDALEELEVAHSRGGGLEEELLATLQRNELWSRSERWALRAADLAGERGQRAQARQMLEHWAAKQRESVPVLSRLGRLAALDRDFDTAIDAFRRVARLERGAAQKSAVLALARVCEAAGRPADSVAEVERALAEGSDTPELRRELVKLYAQSGEHAKHAKLLLEDARAAKPPVRAEMFLKAAELFFQQPSYEEALDALERYCADEPERVEGAHLKARIIAAKEGAARARKFIEGKLADVQKLDKRHAKLLRLLGELHLSDDELAEALSPLTQAHQLDKSDGNAAFVLGLLAFDLGISDLAAASLRGFLATKETASTGPQVSKAYYVLACIEHAKGQRSVARRMATRAIEVDGANEAARRLLGGLG